MKKYLDRRPGTLLLITLVLFIIASSIAKG